MRANLDGMGPGRIAQLAASCLMFATLSCFAGVHCQSHFRPILRPYPLPSRAFVSYPPSPFHQQVAAQASRGASLVASLGGRGQSYLNQMVQQHRIQQQRHQNPQRHAPPSDRRASSSAGASVNQLLSMSASQHQQVPASTKHKMQPETVPQQQQQVNTDNGGKMLICYYATKHSAPYWPKDAREFVVPAERLNQVVASFAPGQPHGGTRSSSQINQQQRQGGALASAHDGSLSFDASARAQEPTPLGGSAAGARKHSSYAAGRMVLVAPKFVPFNRTASKPAVSNEQLVADPSPQPLAAASSPFAHIFSLPNNEQPSRHNTIASRQDNAASITTTGATNQPQPRHHSQPAATTVPQMAAELLVANNDNLGLGGGGLGGGIVFDKTARSKHDLGARRNFDGGRMTIVNEAAILPAKTNLPQQASLASSLVLFSDQQNNGAAARQPPVANNANIREHHQSEKGAAQMKQQQQQLIYASSPPMSRTFIVGASVAAPLVTSGGGGDYSDQAQAQTVPLASNADQRDYYYYFNQPSQTRAGGSSSGPAAATTLSLATVPYQPPTQRHQANSNVDGAQRGKSLQVAESEVSPALPISSLPPITFVEAPSESPPPTYSINGVSSQSMLDRLIVSNGPTSGTASKQQQYLGSAADPAVAAAAATAQAHSTSFAEPSSLLTPSSGQDSSVSSVIKTTPIASSDGASVAFAPARASSSATDSQQQPVTSLPANGLPIAYPSPTLNAPAQTPNGSSTGPATSASRGVAMMPSANPEAEGDNRDHHHHQPPGGNNRQIVGVGGGSLSAALVSSPLSTMFDVFGAASQYLMRFKPSSLISPSSFASLNSVIGDSSGHHHNPRPNSSSPLVSLPFATGGILGASSGLHKSSNTSNSGFLSRLTLQSHQRREDICGRTIQLPERRIIGGEGAKYGEFPYQVHIKIAKHQCGGALIDKQSIVTAAHCVYHFITRAPVSKLQIVIGAYDIEDEQYQELPPQYFKVNKVKLHPNFRFSASHPDRYDIAILKLDKPVKYTDNVLPVCLPSKDLKYENMVGTVTGFGKTDPSLSNRYGTRLLQKVDVPIIENSECERWHRTRGIDLKIFPEMMCAGYEDGLKDACVGDSGGPLVIKTPVGSNGSFRWTLAGITSAGFGCAQSRQPGIYHRVSHTVDWILDNLD